MTQGQYAAVMGANPSRFEDERYPVEQVSWFDALEYANALSLLEGLSPCYELSVGGVSWPLGLGCEGYRLPTEAEWEYLARAGEQTAWSFGDDEKELSEYGWYSGNSEGSAHAVGLKGANRWGLYDVHGNVWEWTWDWYVEGYEMSELDEEGHRVDPLGPGSGGERVLRGGSWLGAAEVTRSVNRNGDTPDGRWSNLGFRLVRSVVSASGDP